MKEKSTRSFFLKLTLAIIMLSSFNINAGQTVQVSLTPGGKIYNCMNHSYITSTATCIWSSNAGLTLRADADADEGYHFVEWTIDGEYYGTAFMMHFEAAALEHASSIKAIFEKNDPMSGTMTEIKLEKKVQLLKGDNNSEICSSIDGNYAVIGTKENAYIFHRTEKGWDNGFNLPNDDTNSNFGCSVAISGNYAFIGAKESSACQKSKCGEIYIYHRIDENIWEKQDIKTSSDSPQTDEGFGTSVDLNGSFGIVGAPQKTVNNLTEAGSAYIETKDSNENWSNAPLPPPPDLTKSEHFGSSVAINGDYAIVGAENKNVNNNPQEGSAYIYHKSVTGEWSFVTELTASDLTSNSNFGSSVSIDNDYAAVGAIGEKQGEGAVYIYHMNELKEWILISKIKPKKPVNCIHFGKNISLNGLNLLVTDQRTDNGGFAYLYHRQTVKTWDEGVEIAQPDNSTFGTGAAISGNSMILGDPLKNDIYFYTNVAGFAKNWSHYPCAKKPGQVIKLIDSKDNIYYELCGTYSDSEFQFDDPNGPPSDYNVSWSMNYPKDEPYNIFFKCQTTNTNKDNGLRYITYDNTPDQPTLKYNSNDNNYYVRCGLGTDSADNTWKSISRNLQQDLDTAEPGNKITKIDFIIYNGGGYVTPPHYSSGTI